MKAKLMKIENFGGGDCCELISSWNDVAVAIKKLNGESISYLIIYPTEIPDEEDFLMVGGGRDNVYVCSYYNGDEYHLVDKSNQDDESVVEVLVGEVSGKLRKHCVGIDQLLPAVKSFCETWSQGDDASWELDVLN